MTNITSTMTNSQPAIQKDKPFISMIAAMDENRIIGANNRLIWSLPDDMQWFREHTLHKPIVMGRKNYQSIGRPLPKRDNIILTRSNQFVAPECTVLNSVAAVFDLAAQKNYAELVIIGGAEIYRLFLPYTDKLYLTFIQHAFQGDCYFPIWDDGAWEKIATISHPQDAKHAYAFEFAAFVRKNAATYP